MAVRTAQPCKCADSRITEGHPVCSPWTQTTPTVSSLPCHAAPACCRSLTAGGSTPGTQSRRTQCDGSSFQLLSSDPSRPKPGPAPGGVPFAKAEVLQLPGKCAKPLHTGQCCNIMLPKGIVSQLCVPPAGRWVLRKTNWHFSCNMYIYKGQNLDAGCLSMTWGLCGNMIFVFIIKERMFKKRSLCHPLTIRMSLSDYQYGNWASRTFSINGDTLGLMDAQSFTYVHFWNCYLWFGLQSIDSENNGLNKGN